MFWCVGFGPAADWKRALESCQRWDGPLPVARQDKLSQCGASGEKRIARWYVGRSQYGTRVGKRLVREGYTYVRTYFVWGCMYVCFDNSSVVGDAETPPHTLRMSGHD